MRRLSHEHNSSCETQHRMRPERCSGAARLTIMAFCHSRITCWAKLTRGKPAGIAGPPLKAPLIAQKEYGVAPELLPLPAWEPSNRGTFLGSLSEVAGIFSIPSQSWPLFPGLIQRLEEPGRPDIRQSNRGWTGQRMSVPLINITKTRLNDPLMWFLGTNEQPGDYRTSGCGSCHIVYANDRDERHSGQWAKYGRHGQSATVDPTIDQNERGHPIQHAFTRAIPSAQCMSCHMHQPAMFLNSYLSHTMWDYESDADKMWPDEQRYTPPPRFRRSMSATLSCGDERAMV